VPRPSRQKNSRKSLHSKSQRLVTDPGYDRIYREGRSGLKGTDAILSALDRGVVGEDCNHELRRITLPRTRVNKGTKKGRESSFDPGPSQGGRYVLLLGPHLLTLKVQL
jgi:hypothetical protein